MSNLKNFKPKNERIKNKYFKFLQTAKQKHIKSVDQSRKSLIKYEEFSHFADFTVFKPEVAIAFKEYLLMQVSKQRGEPFSQHALNSILQNVKDFLEWLSFEPSYKKYIKLTDIAYLKPSLKEMAMVRRQSFVNFASIKELESLVFKLPSETDIQKRDRAIIAFTLLTGVRDGTLKGFKLKHINLEKELLHQDPKEVETKFSKEIYTFFFPVDFRVKQIFVDYYNFLIKEKGFTSEDPLFPKLESVVSNECLPLPPVMTKQHYKSTNPIRQVFKEAFIKAEMQYHSPHTFRHSLVAYGEEICRNPEEFVSCEPKFRTRTCLEPPSQVMAN
jgi:integrase/recombinase XerD